MSIQKIFMTLIIVIVCLIVGALVLNVIMPNVLTQMVNAVEGAIYSGTGMNFDLNGDGTKGAGYSNTADQGLKSDTTGGTGGAGVGGYDGFKGTGGGGT